MRLIKSPGFHQRPLSIKEAIEYHLCNGFFSDATDLTRVHKELKLACSLMGVLVQQLYEAGVLNEKQVLKMLPSYEKAEK